MFIHDKTTRHRNVYFNHISICLCSLIYFKRKALNDNMDILLSELVSILVKDYFAPSFVQNNKHIVLTIATCTASSTVPSPRSCNRDNHSIQHVT